MLTINHEKQGEERTLKITWITCDPECQARVRLNEEKICEYTEHLKKGGTFNGRKPVVFFDAKEKKNWLAGGWHRFEAYKRAGKSEIPCEVIPGTKRCAIRFAMQDNHDHGLPRTNEDKRKAVQMALEDPYYKHFADKFIANFCKVSQPFVATCRSHPITVIGCDPELDPIFFEKGLRDRWREIIKDGGTPRIAEKNEELFCIDVSGIQKSRGKEVQLTASEEDEPTISPSDEQEEYEVTSSGGSEDHSAREVDEEEFDRGITEHYSPEEEEIGDIDANGNPIESDKLRDNFGDSTIDGALEVLDIGLQKIKEFLRLGKLAAHWNLWIRLSDGDKDPRTKQKPLGLQGSIKEALKHLENAAEILENAKPHTVHQNCKGAGCGLCRHTGFLPSWAIDQEEQTEFNRGAA